MTMVYPFTRLKRKLREKESERDSEGEKIKS